MTVSARAREFVARRAGERRIGERGRRDRHVVGDDALDLIDGAAVADRGLQHRDLLGVERRIAEQFVDEPGCRAGQLLPREGDQHGALALAQVVAGGLAGHRGVAEDAEQVVAQLERDAERKAERAQRRDLRERAAGERRAEWRAGASTLYFADL